MADLDPDSGLEKMLQELETGSRRDPRRKKPKAEKVTATIGDNANPPNKSADNIVPLSTGFKKDYGDEAMNLGRAINSSPTVLSNRVKSALLVCLLALAAKAHLPATPEDYGDEAMNLGRAINSSPTVLSNRVKSALLVCLLALAAKAHLPATPEDYGDEAMNLGRAINSSPTVLSNRVKSALLVCLLALAAKAHLPATPEDYGDEAMNLGRAINSSPTVLSNRVKSALLVCLLALAAKAHLPATPEDYGDEAMNLGRAINSSPTVLSNRVKSALLVCLLALAAKAHLPATPEDYGDEAMNLGRAINSSPTVLSNRVKSALLVCLLALAAKAHLPATPEDYGDEAMNLGRAINSSPTVLSNRVKSALLVCLLALAAKAHLPATPEDYGDEAMNLGRAINSSPTVLSNRVKSALLVCLLALAAKAHLPATPEDWEFCMGLMESPRERAIRRAEALLGLMGRKAGDQDASVNFHTKGSVLYANLRAMPLGPYPGPTHGQNYQEYVDSLAGYQVQWFRETLLDNDAYEYAAPAALLFQAQIATVLDSFFRGGTAFRVEEGSKSLPAISHMGLGRSLACLLPGEDPNYASTLLMRVARSRGPAYAVDLVYTAMLSRVFHPRSSRLGWIVQHLAATMKPDVFSWVISRAGRGEERDRGLLKNILADQEISDHCYYEKPARSAERWSQPALHVPDEAKAHGYAASFYAELRSYLAGKGLQTAEEIPQLDPSGWEPAACPVEEDAKAWVLKAFPEAEDATEAQADAGESDLTKYLPTLVEPRVATLGLAEVAGCTSSSTTPRQRSGFVRGGGPYSFGGSAPKTARSQESDNNAFLCGTTRMGELYALPQEFECPRVPSQIQNITSVQVALYTDRIKPFVFSATRCYCVQTEICTRMSLVGGRGVLSTQEIGVPVGFQECRRAKSLKTIRNQILHPLSTGFWGTQRPATQRFHYCCYDYCYSVLNCFLQSGEVAVHPATHGMASDLGDLSQCQFRNGHCLVNNDMVMWTQYATKQLCPFAQKGIYNATLADNRYLVVEEVEGAFELVRPVQSSGISGSHCLPPHSILSAQGVVVSFVSGPPSFLSFLSSSRRPGSPTLGPHDSDPINAKLTYLAWRSFEQETRSFSAIWTNYCLLAKTLSFTIRQLARVDATLAVRAFFQREDIVAVSCGDALMVWQCHTVLVDRIHWDYRVNDTCYSAIPVSWNNQTWFLVPGTRELTKHHVPVPCQHTHQGVYRSSLSSHGSKTQFRTVNGPVAVGELSLHGERLQGGKPTSFRAPPVFESEKYFHVTKLEMLTSFLHQSAETRMKLQALAGYTAEFSFDPDMVRRGIENEGKKIGAFVTRTASEAAHSFGHVTGVAGNWLSGLLRGPCQTLLNVLVLLGIGGLGLFVSLRLGLWWLHRPHPGRLTRVRGTQGFQALWQRLQRSGLGWLRRGHRYISRTEARLPPTAADIMEMTTFQANEGQSTQADIHGERQATTQLFEDDPGESTSRGRRTVPAPEGWGEPTRTRSKRRRESDVFVDVSTVEEGGVAASTSLMRPIVHMEMARTLKCFTLVDTGSCRSFITPGLLEKLSTAGFAVTRLRNKPLTVISASNHSIELHQRVEVPFRLFGKSWVQTFYVLENFSSGNECLLGIDFLAKVGPVVVDIGRKLLWSAPNAIPPSQEKPSACSVGTSLGAASSLHPLNPRHGRVCLAKSQRLKGLCTTWVRCEIPSLESRDETDILVEPCQKRLARNWLEMEACVTKVSEGSTWLPITNYSKAPCQLHSGTRLGSFQIIGKQGVSVQSSDTRCGSCDPTATAVGAVGKAGPQPPPGGPAEGLDAAGVSQEQHESNLRAAKIGGPKTPPEQIQKIQKLLVSYSDCFSRSDEDFGCTNADLHRIRTTDDRPVVGHSRLIPLAKREGVTKITDSLLRMGVIRESHSPNLSPIVIVKKKDGSDRFCTDFRRLNQKTVPDEFPLPTTEEILSSLDGSKYYSSLDLNSGYFQVMIHPDDRHWTSFRTHDGLFEYNKMAMGLTGAVATFQRLMTKVLKGILWKGVFCYLDDILCTGTTFDEHMRHLESVLQRLRAANLKCKLRKCEFLKPHVQYLGHKISAKGIEVCKQKVEAVKDYPRPSNVKALQRFLGLCTYYHRFVDSFAAIASPLYALLKTNTRYNWTSAQETAFQTLKNKLTSPPILTFPVMDRKRPFLLQCDASTSGLGVVCCQLDQQGQERVVGYASRTLTKSEKNYPPVQLEALAILYGLKKFKPIIFGHPTVIVQSDHRPLQFVLASFDSSSMLQRWALRIQEFGPTISYKQASKNRNADALSRLAETSPLPFPDPKGPPVVPESSQTAALADGQPNMDVELLESQKRDPFAKAMTNFLTTGQHPTRKQLRERVLAWSHCFTLIQGYLYFVGEGKEQLYVPKDAVPCVLHSLHSSVFSGHFAFQSTYERIRKRYYWPDMAGQILAFCSGCRPCQLFNAPNPAVREPLQPISSSRPWELISSDIMGPISPHSGPFKYILAFTDYFTSYAVAVPLTDISSATIAKVFMERIVLVFGRPDRWLTDRAANFCSELVKELARTMGTAKVATVPYHPAGDGKIERWNRTCISILCKHCADNPSEWADSLPYAVFAYNTSLSRKIGTTPFHALFSFDCAIPVPLGIRGPRIPFYVDQTDYRHEAVSHLRRCWDSIRERMEKEQKRQKLQYDKKARPQALKQGDLVYYRKFVHDKISNRYSGPWRVIAVNAPNATIIPLHAPSCEPKTVHMNHLKPHVNIPTELRLELPEGVEKPSTPPEKPRVDAKHNYDLRPR